MAQHSGHAAGRDGGGHRHCNDQTEKNFGKMNRKQFILLLVLVVVVGAAGLLVRERSSNSWKSATAAIGQKLLPNLAVNDIAQITIKSGASELNLVRRDNRWRVRERGDYPANFSQISELLIKLADLKIAQSEEIGPSQLGRLELQPPGAGANSGTQLEFKDQAGKTLDSLLLGKKHMKKPVGNSQPGGMGDEGWPDGRYVMAGAGAKTVAVISDPLDSAQPKPEEWLDKDFLSIEKPRTIAVQFSEPTNSWKLSRASETNDWQLADAKADEKIDSSKISSVTSAFSSPSFNDVTALNTSSTASNSVVTVETFDGFTYIARIAPRQDDNYPVSFSVAASLATERPAAKDEKAEDKAGLDKEFKGRQSKLTEKLAKEKQFENWVYQVPAYSVDEILKPRQQLLTETKTNAPAGEEK
jgi:Tfp pilus assembly protein PilN